MRLSNLQKSEPKPTSDKPERVDADIRVTLKHFAYLVEMSEHEYHKTKNIEKHEEEKANFIKVVIQDLDTLYRQKYESEIRKQVVAEVLTGLSKNKRAAAFWNKPTIVVVWENILTVLSEVERGKK